MLKIAICESDQFYKENLKESIASILNEEGVQHEITLCPTLYCLLNKNVEDLDLLFIDICLTKNKNNDIESTIKSRNPKLHITSTTTIEDLSFITTDNYTVKPVRQKLLQIYLKNQIASICENKDLVTISSKNENLMLPVDDILYAQSSLTSGKVCTCDEEYKVDVGMRKLESKLIKHKFFRCHFNYLVNLRKIEYVNNKSVVINEKEIPVSKFKIKELKKKLTYVLGEML